MKKKFTIRNVAGTIANFDKRLAEIYEQFYDRSIDFGAHPNPNALFGAMTYKLGEEETKVGQLLMSTDMVAVEHAIKSAAQVGLCILFIYQHIFEAKFELLGIHEEIEKLRRQHL